MTVQRWIAMALLVAAIMAGELAARRAARAQDAAPGDVEQTSQGALIIRPLTHGSVLFLFGGKVYYVDPAQSYDWASLPKADLILITHEHGDHCSPGVVAQIKKDDTQIVASASCAAKIPGAVAMRNGDRQKFLDVMVEAVPAYNLMRKASNGQPFHPRERDNGYILTFGDRRVYLAGDTEATPEMKALQNIDVAFLPIDGSFTMTPEEAADAVRAFKPRILYPYHQNNSDPSTVKTRLADVTETEVRVRHLP